MRLRVRRQADFNQYMFFVLTNSEVRTVFKFHCRIVSGLAGLRFRGGGFFGFKEGACGQHLFVDQVQEPLRSSNVPLQLQQSCRDLIQLYCNTWLAKSLRWKMQHDS